MRDGDAWTEVTIGNISVSGLMVKCPEPRAVGSQVELRRRGVTVDGRVVWSRRSRFGLQSTEPIDVDALTAQSGLTVNQSHAETLPRQGLWHWRRR